MDAGAVLVTFLSGSAVGGLLTTVLRSSHERSERFRDRMVEVGGEFIERVERVSSQIEDLGFTMTDVLARRKELGAALASVNEAYLDNGGEQGDPPPRILDKVKDLLGAVDASWTSGAPLEDDARVRALAEEVRAASDEQFGDTPERREVNRRMLDATAAYAPVMIMLLRQERQVLRDVGVMTGQLARLRIVFAGDQEVARQALSVVQLVGRDAETVARRYGARGPLIPGLIEDGPSEVHASPAESGAGAEVLTGDVRVELVAFGEVVGGCIRRRRI